MNHATEHVSSHGSGLRWPGLPLPGEAMGTGTPSSWDNPSLICLVTRPTERPDRPRDLELTDLAERSVRLTWIPGDDNNSPITGQPRDPLAHNPPSFSHTAEGKLSLRAEPLNSPLHPLPQTTSSSLRRTGSNLACGITTPDTPGASTRPC